MKRSIQAKFLCIALGATIFFSGCGKNNTPGSPGTGGLNIMYPSTMSFYDGVNSSYPYVYKYKYDAKNLLVQYGTDSVIHAISNHVVNLTTYSFPYQMLTAYAWKMAYRIDTSVDIYAGTPTEVSIDFFTKNVVYGNTTSTHQNDIFREYTGGGLLQKEITTAGGGQNINYAYDDKKNLKTIEWVNLTGPRTLAPYARLTVMGLDDKPSPFVAVQGYKIASYPQSYPIDFSLAFCNNNPTQIKVEDYDEAKNAMVLYEQDDFTYTYNANGYPTTIVVNITYYNATTSHYTRTYNFTYK